MKIIFLFVFFVLLFGVIQFADNAEAIAYFPPPLKQISEGTEPDAVTCTEGLEIIFKQSNGMPACVKPSSVQKLVDRGYAIVVSHQEDMRIGLLFSTSGDFATHGYESYIAANMAIDDFNEHLKSIGKEIRLIPASIDTASESQNTLEYVKKLHNEGVGVFIGPQISADVEMIKPYVDSTQILVLSPASTAPSLAVADNIYRLVPDDTNQGRIISILLTEDNITTVFLLVRDDVWGNDLADAIKEFYAGKISQINYNPDESLFEEKLQELSDLVTAEPTKENVAIISIGAGETVEIMLHATNYDVLDDVKWFGTDANANEEKILENDLTSTFAQDVSFTTVQFASDRTNPDNRNLESRLFIELEYLPNTYAFAAYDAVWLVGLSMLDTNSTDPNIIKSAIPDVVQSYNGMLGDLDFNEAGDLDSDNYDIWYVKDGQWYNEPRQ